MQRRAALGEGRAAPHSLPGPRRAWPERPWSHPHGCAADTRSGRAGRLTTGRGRGPRAGLGRGTRGSARPARGARSPSLRRPRESPRRREHDRRWVHQPAPGAAWAKAPATAPRAPASTEPRDPLRDSPRPHCACAGAPRTAPSPEQGCARRASPTPARGAARRPGVARCHGAARRPRRRGPGLGAPREEPLRPPAGHREVGPFAPASGFGRAGTCCGGSRPRCFSRSPRPWGWSPPTSRLCGPHWGRGAAVAALTRVGGPEPSGEREPRVLPLGFSFFFKFTF